MAQTSISANRSPGSWLLIAASAGTALLACGSPSERAPEQLPGSPGEQLVVPEVRQRADAVLTLHDDVMPERARLMRLQRQLGEVDLPNESRAFAKTRLERADSLMMAWMYSDVPVAELADSLDTQALLEYLAMREAEIRDVADSMHVAMSNAEMLLAQ